MKRYRVKKGRHYFTPLNWPSLFYGSFSIELKFKFGKSCRYEIEGPDQFDYNKIGGISDHLLVNNKNAAMVGWRYFPDRDKIECAPYFNLNNEISIGRKTIWVEPDNLTITRAIIKKNSITGFYEVSLFNPDTNSWIQEIRRVLVKKKIAKRIGPWFGGQAKAPHEMDIYIDCKRIS